MADEVHEVVKLLLARMESHPEEFDGSHTRSRWYTTLIDIEEYAPAEHAALVKAKVAAIRLDKTHREVMDELLNGEDRRRKEAEEDEYERHLAAAAKHAQIQQNTQKAIYDIDTDTYRVTATAARYPTSTDMENNGIVSALRKLVS